MVDDEQQKKITSVAAAGNYTYALVTNKNQLYSWGMGENYVLGNREDSNEFKPYAVDQAMFESKKVLQVACGTQHVVVLVQDAEGAEKHAVDHSTFTQTKSEFPPPKVPQEGEEEAEDEDAPQVPEFVMNAKLRQQMIGAKERASTANNEGPANPKTA